MIGGYCLIYYNRLEVIRSTENRKDEDQLNQYVFIDNGKIIDVLYN